MPHSGQGCLRGVVLRHSTGEPVEQRGAIFSGDGGGKGAGQGEHRSVQHEPDTERGTSVPGTGRCASGSKGKEAGTVYRFAPPYDDPSAAGQLSRVEAECCTRGGWGYVERVWSRIGGSARRSAQPDTRWNVPGKSFAESLYSEGRRAATSVGC